MNDAVEIREVLVHEFGHYLCATELGLRAFMYSDLSNNHFFVSHTERPKTRESLEEEAVIHLAGMAAEDLVGIDLGQDGSSNDLSRALEAMRELYRLDGQECSIGYFQSRDPSRRPILVMGDSERETFKRLMTRSKELLLKQGGSDALIAYADEAVRKLTEIMEQNPEKAYREQIFLRQNAAELARNNREGQEDVSRSAVQ